MKIIIGLGNPGEQYIKTRHNAGFMLLNYLRVNWQCAHWRFQKRFQTEISKNPNCILVKPQTFMNLSGESVDAILKKYELNHTSDLIIAFDDLDLEVGKWKLQKGRGPRGHNGLESIYNHLGTKDFWHLRIGIDGRQGIRLVDPKDYVLSDFSSEEKRKLKQVFAEISVELRK